MKMTFKTTASTGERIPTTSTRYFDIFAKTFFLREDLDQSTCKFERDTANDTNKKPLIKTAVILTRSDLS